ncbi:MAG: serine/threonine protein kinase [Planctomycetaceae bacterium]
MSDEQLNPVDALAEEFSQRLKAGENPTIEEYVEQSPEHADVIRAMFPSIQMMERVSKQERTEQDFDRRTRKLTDQKKLGDFAIRRELGRGGMGIVYEAVQQSLRRRVALKILAPHIADSETQLKRFHREAKAAARLHHTNIVPVYGIGQADGLHFIAMQFIEGVTLQEKLAESTQARTLNSGHSEVPSSSATAVTQISAEASSVSSITEDFERPAALDNAPTQRGSSQAFNEAARIVRDTADALQYAHEHGIQHRDIKPGNLLLDGSGTVWVTDFGLAKHESDEAATKTGDIVGTVRYMAPEQFAGTEDARSDIYSLGLTLYELLTHEPAYKSTSAVRLMQQKANEPPRSPRAIVKNLPADLETITLKACAIEPKDRYQSARELETDLALFLEDRPILSRRVTPVERLWRWARRNKAIATLSTATLLLLMTTATVFAIGNYRTGKALKKADKQKELAVAQRKVADRERADARAAEQRAQNTLNLAIEAFDQIMVNISSRGSSQAVAIEIEGEEFAPAASVVTTADAELLETLLSFFERFSAENSFDLSHKTAEAYARVGAIQLRLGRLTDAEVAYDKSLRTYAALTASTDSYSIQRARVHREMMNLCAKGGDPRGVRDHYVESKSLLQQSTDSTTRFELALTMNELTKRISETRSVREIVAPSRGVGGRPGGGRGPRPFRSRGFGMRRDERRPPYQRLPRAEDDGPAWKGMGGEAHNASKQAVEILKQLVAEEESNREYRLALARAHRNVADSSREHEERLEAVTAAITELKWLTENSPNSPVYQFEYASTLCHRIIRGQRVFSGARRHLATRIARRLVNDYPEVPEYKVLLAKSISQGFGRRDEPTADAWQETVQIYRGLREDYPTSFVYALTLASHLRTLSSVVRADSPSDARKLLEEAAAVLGEAGEASSGPEQRRIADLLLGQLRGLLSKSDE